MKKYFEIITNSLIGMPLGVTANLFAYVCIYFILGEEAYIKEIYQLTNLTILIMQSIIVSFAWFNMFIIINISRNCMKPTLKRIILIELIVSILFIISMVIIDNKKFFSANVSDMNVILLVISIVVIGFASMCFQQINKHVINKKIKEFNNS